jgi:hypothetical protein
LPRITINVFMASPGDLAVERRAFKDVIDELNGGFGDGASVRFVPLGWEDTLATGHRALRTESALQPLHAINLMERNCPALSIEIGVAVDRILSLRRSERRSWLPPHSPWPCAGR